MSTKKGEKLERRVIEIKRVKGERETEKLPITGNYRIETNTVIRYLNTHNMQQQAHVRTLFTKHINQHHYLQDLVLTWWIFPFLRPLFSLIL